MDEGINVVSCEGRGSDSADDAIIVFKAFWGMRTDNCCLLVSPFLSIELNGKEQQRRRKNTIFNQSTEVSHHTTRNRIKNKNDFVKRITEKYMYIRIREKDRWILELLNLIIKINKRLLPLPPYLRFGDPTTIRMD